MTLNYTELMALIWSLWGASFILTASRGFLRWKSQRRIFADDYFVFFGLLSLTALSAVITCLLPQFFLAQEYMKELIVDPLTPMPLPPDEFVERTRTSLKFMFSQMLLFWTTLWAAKFSILFFFRRLVIGLPAYMRAWWACFVLVLLLYLASVASNFLTCRPLSKYWSATGCSDPDDIIRADASIKFATSADVVSDALIMLLPLNLLRKLQVSPQQKFGLAVIFSLGTVIIAFAFARLAQVTKATSNPDPATLADGPVLLSMWSHIESSVSVIVATLPAFRYLLNGKMGRTRPSRSAPPVYGSAEPSASGAQSKARRVFSGHRWSHNTGLRLPSSEQGRKGSNDWGSETELRPMAGIEKQVDFSIERDLATPRQR
ncbi:uncharacterized protein ALTATR162_LOCUS4470 [Alternaria atra]|uniref:Rhodopsin domain-containing protein n=1 Tax=Alternaria atra TaxID=119953 RepID=A0A8J2I0Q7_9PLEO|nr:uncharacterized protein ALTATR162_LOCUS4470 [Alternaria atra]CAG5156673.1 unnamed protein product [Alternaria atra]